MKKLEKLNDEKFSTLEREEMKKLLGGVLAPIATQIPNDTISTDPSKPVVADDPIAD